MTVKSSSEGDIMIWQSKVIVAPTLRIILVLITLMIAIWSYVRFSLLRHLTQPMVEKLVRSPQCLRELCVTWGSTHVIRGKDKCAEFIGDRTGLMGEVNSTLMNIRWGSSSGKRETVESLITSPKQARHDIHGKAHISYIRLLIACWIWPEVNMRINDAPTGVCPAVPK